MVMLERLRSCMGWIGETDVIVVLGVMDVMEGLEEVDEMTSGKNWRNRREMDRIHEMD